MRDGDTLRITLLAYYFPPMGGGGTQRPVNFVRHLPHFGIEPSVVTGPEPVASSRWAPLERSSGEAGLRDSRIHRVKRSEPALPTKWEDRTERWMFHRSPWTSWLIDEFSTTACSLPHVAALWAVMPPYGLAEAAARASTRLGVPWIADLGDPWALDEMLLFPSDLHRSLERRRMRRCLSTAAAIVMSTDEAVRRTAQAYPELRDRPIVAIPNGYNASDFAGERPIRDDGKFRIVHTGTLHTELALQQREYSALRRAIGGYMDGVDILTRTHVYLMQAVNELLTERPMLKDVLEVHFSGVLTPQDVAIAKESPVSHLHGYLPHPESIALARTADLLFLPMQNVRPGARAATVPGKTYEYLASGVPVLGAMPPGDARDIVQQYGDADICDPDARYS
jgi:glycosyltransferase involved in cell wall biosynthesis